MRELDVVDMGIETMGPEPASRNGRRAFRVASSEFRNTILSVSDLGK